MSLDLTPGDPVRTAVASSERLPAGKKRHSARSLEEGVSFIGKPFSLAVLAEKVRKVLEG